jgi:hypothetical protein
MSVHDHRHLATAHNGALAFNTPYPSPPPLLHNPAQRDEISALKRLLREAFAEQVSSKARLAALEDAAARSPEAGDGYDASLTAGGRDGGPPVRGGGACGALPLRALLRASGVAGGGAALVWSQGADGGAAAALAAAHGAAADAGVALWLHSVLDGGAPAGGVSAAKQPAAAAAAPAQQEGGAPKGGQPDASALPPPARDAAAGGRQRLTAKLVQAVPLGEEAGAGALQLEQVPDGGCRLCAFGPGLNWFKLGQGPANWLAIPHPCRPRADGPAARPTPHVQSPPPGPSTHPARTRSPWLLAPALP